MIRHARPASGWGDADPDPGLAPEGLQQARAVAVLLQGLDDPPRAVVASPMRRCQETARPFAEALGAPVLVDPRVGEIPTPAGLDPRERPAWLRRAFAGGWDEIEGGDVSAWREGVLQALREHEGAAVFSHFVALNAAVSAVRGEDRTVSFRPAHTSVTTFRLEGDGLSLVSLGAEMDTEVL
jgi:broad specificity phosphatase PhoE